MPSFLSRALVGGMVLGATGFACGFFGPIALSPEANQGPLLGIFITGPLGLIAGLVFGALASAFRGEREP